MVNGLRRLDSLGSFLFLVLFCKVFQATGVRVGKCPDLPRRLSQRCPPDTIDQCKYDEDCTGNNQQKCCVIGCGKICFNPGDLAFISGNSKCPVLPRPDPCPNLPNQCLKRDECKSGQECCSDGCRMTCQPIVTPTTQPTKGFEWESCNATVDVAFIIDSSGSIARRNYKKIKDFVKFIASSFGISPNGTRAGIVLYSTKASVRAYFNDSRTTDEFLEKVDKLPHERGFTYINKALELASSQLFSHARKDVPKVAMLLTDGEQTDPGSTVNLRDASAPLRWQGVRVIAFGVGKRINVRELRLTVERDEDVITVMKFDDLIKKVRNYTRNLCEAAATEPIHPDADIIFLMDSSAGVSWEQLNLQQQFVRRMAHYFIISPLGPRGALVTYHRSSVTVIGFSDYSSTADFSRKINNARLLGGARRIDQALNYATKMFQDTGREGLRIVILLTAGNYYSGRGANSISSVVTRLRSIDAHLYVIGIGSQFTPSVFTQMVRRPSDIFQVPSFNDLAPWQSRIARKLRLASNTFKYEPSDFRSDVIFLMDSSRFVTKENYMLEKNYVKLMARLLNLANNRSRSALYAYSDRPMLQITFDGYEDREAFETAVNRALHLQRARRIDRALVAAAELLRTRSRPSVPKYVILLTTGRQTQVADTRSLRETSQQIRSYGGRLFVVAILTGGYNVRDFYQAVQRPEDVISVPSFISLLPRASFMASRIMATWRAPEAPAFSADITFILDSSSAVTPFQYARAQRFVRILSEYLNISPGKSRGSLITVGDSPVVNFNFDGYNTHAEFRTLVTDASYLGGSSSINSALRTAATMFTGARGSYPWLVILVTPWRPSGIRDTRALEAAARPLLNRGIWLYVLSVSENRYIEWLRPVVVEPRDAFSVVSYRDLPANIGSLASYMTADSYLYGGSKFLLDVIFLMDSSSGINSRDYSIEKWFIQRMAMHLGVFQGKTVAGLLTYGGNASIVFPLGGYSSNSEFIRRLYDAPIMGGVRQTDRALDTAAALLLRSRSTLPKAVVLITAGDQNTAPGTIPLEEAARPLRQLGAWVYVITVGRMDVKELEKVMIRPTDMFLASSFSGLYGFVSPVGTYVANTSVITGTSSLNADIVFIIDCSLSVPYREYQRQKDFVKSLAQYLNIQPGQSRVSLIVYGGRAMPILHFDSSSTLERFYSELAKTPYLAGPRNVDTALTIATQSIFIKARENVPKVVLLFMAGKQARPSGSLRDSVRPLHQQGIRTFIFRIGSEPALRDLHAAVDLPGDVFEFASFADLDLKRVPYLARHIPYFSAFLGPLSLAVDVVYLIDSSESVTSQHYDDQKTFVKQLSRFLNMMPGRTRGAIITYGSTATVISNFGATSTTQEFYSALDRAPKIGGPRRMDRAVDKARAAFAKARPAVPQVVILLTAGNQQRGIQASILDTSFQQLYNLGARLYAVTISRRHFLLPLRGTAGSDWFPVKSFIDLPRYVVPLSRYVAHDTAALGPYNFVADVVFMLDSSSDVTPDEFVREKEFVKLIARYLNITPGKSRGSVIIFSTEARPILPFDGYTDITGFNSIIDRAPQISGTRRIDRAFNATANLFQNSRPSVRRVAILLTSGRQSPDGGSLVDAMQLMKNRDVITYVISLGRTSDVPVERPQDLLYVASYNDLPEQVQTIASSITTPRVAILTTPTPTPTQDPCVTPGCNAPFSEGCRVLNNRPQCICPTCTNILRPICASDGVQDQSECNMKQQACRGNIWVNVTKEGPCDKECSPLLDIAFIIDSSGSIGRRNWERTKRFVKAVISKLVLSASAAHVAAIAYSTDPRVVIRFNSFQGTLQVNQVVDSMRWQRGFTYTDKALLLADSDLFQTSNGMRTNAKKIAIVITDGKQTTTSQYTKLSEASSGIKDKGITVYAIGVGSGVDRAELVEIASGLDYVFTSSSFESLQNEASKIRKSVCEVSSPNPCQTNPCNAPYNIGCEVVDNVAQCICPTCPNILKPVCASDDVVDLSECHLKRQACQGNIVVSVAKQTPCDKDCRPIMDLAFIIDSSGSIGRGNWERIKRFLKALVSKLDVSASATHVAAIAYSTNPRVVMTFRNFQGTSQVNRVFDAMAWQRGLTYTDKALLLADRDLFQTTKGMRSSVPKVAFVITDGKQTTTGAYTRLSAASQGMKNKGVTVYALGVGSGVDRAELEQIASGSQNIYTSASFKDLQNIAGGIRRHFCKAYVTGPSTIPTPTTSDPCATGCTAPFNEGCRVVNDTAQCICPSCQNIFLPVCASDGVQDQSDCHMRKQACQGDIDVTVAKRGDCDKECRNVVDVAFVIDSSGSIGRKNWERMKRFLKALVSKLDVDSSATRIAAIAYSTKPKVVTKFDGFQSTNQVNRLFDRMLWQRGVTYTDKALLLANREVFQTSAGMRPHVPKLAIVVTDGKQTKVPSYTRLSVASQGMKDKGVIVYAVGVGRRTDSAELEEIASGSRYVLVSSSFKDLQNLAPEMTRRLCEHKLSVSTPPPTTTPLPTTPDLCQTPGCRAPYNIGCRVVDNKAECVCPTCVNTRRPVCATDGVQDLNECHLRRQACEGDIKGVAVAVEEPCGKECSAVLDIAFVIDSSGSIGRKNWQKMKRFLKAFASRLDVRRSATRIAAVAYSNNAEVVTRFNDLQSTEEVNRKFDGMRWQRGFTYTDKALLLADRDAFQTTNGMRSSVPKLAVVITDGKQTTSKPYTKLAVASQGMKNKGVTVYALGVGNGADRAELLEISSGPQYVFISPSFEDLQKLVSLLTREFCKDMLITTVSTPPPTTTPFPTTPLPTTPDPCQTIGCRAPYNIGCRAVDNKAECVCPTCVNTRRPVCATDGVQDLNECHLRRQACEGDIKGVAVAVEEPCGKECSVVLDIAFVIDSSGSIGRKNWQKMKRFLKAFASRLDVRRSATRIAAVAYSNNAEVVTTFNDLQSTEEVNRKFDEMRWQRGLTYTDKALLVADRRLFQTTNGMRSSAPKLAFVITDGKQSTLKPHTKLSVASQGMKNKGVTVYALGVGSNVDGAELLEISSGPQYVFTSSSFEDLQNLVLPLTREFCKDRLTTTVPTPPPTTTPFPTTPLPTTPDPCQRMGCRAPYNIGCRVVDNKAECLCPTCENTRRRPVCATDGVQDLNECHLRRQACEGDIKTIAVAKEEPCDKECSAVVDIAFVIDSSGSIGRKNWQKMKRFLKAFASRLDVSRSATHIAAVAYSNNAEVVTRFNDIQSTEEVNRKFDGMRWQRGFTYTDKALLLVDRDLLQTANGMRSSAPKLAVVITDGKQTTSKPYTKLSVASQGMKNKGVTVYALGVGNGADRAELLEISSGPQYVFTSSSFEGLENLGPLLTREFCKDRVTTTVSTQSLTTTPSPATPDRTDPCESSGCRAPYNIGCRVVENQAECICPLCPDVLKPVCSNDGVQDRSLCNLRRQSCLGNKVAYSIKTGPCDKDCHPVLDIAFIVDSSGSIGKTNWERTKRFLKALVSKLDVSPGRTHVAAVAYSTDPFVIMRFNDVQDTDGVNRVLDGMRWQRGLTFTDKALQLADRDILQTSNGMRPNIAKIVILITDGKQTKDGQSLSLLEASEGIKKKGVTMYAIGVGNGVDRNELEEIASSPDKVLTSSSFRELAAIAPQMRKAICQSPKATHLADIIFLMDASRETTSTYATEKDLIKSFARYLNIDPQGTRAALIAFSGRPSVISDFESFRSLPEFESKVDKVRHFGGSRSVSDALRGAAGMFPKSPSSVSKIIFLVTSGKPLLPQDKKSAGNVVDELSDIGVRTYLALVGPSPNIQEYRFLVDDTKSVFTVESSSDVPKQINQVGSYILTETVTPKKLNLTTYVLFVLDSSEAVSPANFKNQKEFVKSIMSQLNLYPRDSDSRVGLIVYSYNARVLLNLDNRESKSSLERIVDNLPHLKGGRRIDRALKAATDVLKDVGTDKPKFVILVAAGQQEPDALSFAAAVKPLHQTGTKTHVLAVGDDVDPSYFKGEDKVKSSVISVPSFTDLPQKTAMLTEDLLKEYVAPTPSKTTPEQPKDPAGKTTTSLPSSVVSTTLTPIQTTPRPTDGDSPPMDVVFLLDTSNRVTQSDLAKQKEFVKLMAQRFDVSPTASHAAVLSYGDRTILIGGLYDYVRGKRFEDNVDSVTLIGGKRNIQEALRQATNHLASFGRENVSHVVFLITYGRQSPELGSQRLQEMVQNVRDTNAILYVVGIGIDADDPQLGLIVERPTDLFEIPRSGDLKLNVPSIVYYSISRAESKVPEDYEAEIIYVVDSSSMVGPVNYRNGKDFIKGLARALNHSPNYTQSAVIIYDTFPHFAIRMGTYPEIGPFSDAVDKLQYRGGQSGGLDLALQFAQRGFSQDRSDVPKIIVLITSRDSPNTATIDSLAATLRREDINVTVLGIGPESNFPNVRRLVVRPDDFLTPKGFDYLPSYVPTVATTILSGSPNLPTDGGWGPWDEWGKCSKTCGTGRQTRERRCDSPRPQNGGEQCQGPSQQLRNCKIMDCPVNGGWGPWTEWSRCTKTCGTGLQTQERRCDSPRPQNGGRQCRGPSQQSRECKIRDCPVHGGWGPWSEWSRCTKTCGTGLQTQERRCDSPRPTSGGRQCTGPSQQSRPCSMRSCEDPEGSCPPYSPTKRCPGLVQDECTCDSDCNEVSNYKCCFDGCRRMCRSTAAQVCTASVDIIYLMDSSGSTNDFEKQKDFVRDLARIFSLESSRAAVVSYDDKATARVNFDDFDSTFEFANAIDRISQTKTQGGSRIDLALEKTSDMFESARTNVPKVLIVLTNGTQWHSMVLDQPVQLLRDQNVRIFAVGIGSNVDINKLKSFVESDADAFLVDLFVDLLRKSQTFAENTCSQISNSTKCVQGVDIAFLMDSSESITDEDFEREKIAVKEIAGRFLSASPDSRAGVIMYSGRPELMVDFGSQNSISEFESAVDGLTHKRSMTRIDSALRFAAERLFSNPRRSASSVAVVMTDGIQTPGPGVEPLRTAVLPLREKGVRVLAVGVGPRVDRSELKDLVTSANDVFQMSSFQELLNKSEELLEVVCPARKHVPGPINTTLITTTAAPVTTTMTTSTITEPIRCEELLDVVFVMDSSRSIDAPQYKQEKDFVKRLANIFKVGAGSRAAVIIYSDETQLKITFDQNSDLSSFLSAVESLPYLQRRTRIDKALTMTAQVVRQARPGFPKVVIVMTDGRQTRDPDALDLNIAAKPIHDQGVRVLVVGIGPEVSDDELQLIVNDPSYVFKVGSFENLTKATQDVAATACINPRPTTIPPPPPCSESFDLVFAMDSSGSIGETNYQKERDFIKGLANKLVVGPRNVHLGLMVFSDLPSVWVSFGTLRSTDYRSFSKAVDGAPYLRGRTRIDTALTIAGRDVFPEGRQNQEPQVLILITDGRQSDDPGSETLEKAVQPLRDQGIKIIIVGIGGDVDKVELRSLVENPNDDLFLVGSFLDLEPLLRNKKLTDAICLNTSGRRQRNLS